MMDSRHIIHILEICMMVFLKFMNAICTLFSFKYRWRKPTRCPPIKDKILLYPACVLAEKIRHRKISSETIVKTYISRIKEVNSVVNAVVEEQFANALEKARHVDKILSCTKLSPDELATKYPLLGLPLTVKESIMVEGFSHASGRVFPNGKRATRDAEVVRLCREAGAIPLLVSNTPELCMNFETFNNVTGTTCNPYDTRRTPGGSSGGEAALLASGASIISIASDLCGSIRLPAHFCGIWGHKPTPGAVNNADHYPNCIHKDVWKEVFHMGPMSRYAVDLQLLLQVIQEKSEKSLLRLDERVPIKNLKFYYMYDDGGCLLTRTVDKSILNSMDKLITYLSTKCGCPVQKLQISDFRDSIDTILIKFFTINDVENLFPNDGTGCFQELKRYLTCRSNSVFPPVFYGVVRYFVVRYMQKSVVTKYNEKLQQFRNKLSQILGENGILLYPCHPTAAEFHGQNNAKIPDYSYMAIFNCLGFPVTNCPLGLNEDGLPVGIQVIAAPNNDRLTMAVALEIEKKLGGWIPPPFSDN